MICTRYFPFILRRQRLDMFLSILFSYVVKLHHFLSVGYQPSQPYKTTVQNIVLYIFFTTEHDLYLLLSLILSCFTSSEADHDWVLGCLRVTSYERMQFLRIYLGRLQSVMKNPSQYTEPHSRLGIGDFPKCEFDTHVVNLIRRWEKVAWDRLGRPYYTWFYIIFWDNGTCASHVSAIKCECVFFSAEQTFMWSIQPLHWATYLRQVWTVNFTRLPIVEAIDYVGIGRPC